MEAPSLNAWGFLFMVKTRTDFPTFLDEKGIVGTGVELGVFKGHFLEHMARNWKGCERFFGVDNFEYKRNSHPGANSNISYQETSEILSEMKGRVQRLNDLKITTTIIQSDSAAAAGWFADNSVSFCYIDASHDYRSVMGNLKAWWPKIKSGGVIAGHDYFNASYRHNLIEVKRAVDDFFYSVATVNFTPERRLPSWYVLK